MGRRPALFRLDDGSVHAVGNIDPFTGAAVMSRGIVGDRGGRATVQSPLKKQAFALDDGVCLDDPTYELPVYATRITPAGDVDVAHHPRNTIRVAHRAKSQPGMMFRGARLGTFGPRHRADNYLTS